MTLDRREIRATALGLAIVLPYVALVCSNSRINLIDLGWHYAIDGIVAAILTIMIWRCAGMVADRLERGQIVAARPIAVVS